MDAFVLGFVFAAPVFLIVGYCCGLYDGTKGWAAPWPYVGGPRLTKEDK